MENKLEQLLNSLIEKGWHPFGRKYDAEKGGDFNTISFSYYNDIDEERGVANYSMRELVSKESQLWQFVRENGMVDKQYGYIEELKWWKADDDEEGHDNGEERYSTEYQFWLIESSLKDESELEDFLLQNIKVDVESK